MGLDHKIVRQSGLQDKINSLNIGADDYLTKPFINEELLAQLKEKLLAFPVDLPPEVEMKALELHAGLEKFKPKE